MYMISTKQEHPFFLKLLLNIEMIIEKFTIFLDFFILILRFDIVSNLNDR